MSRFVRFALVGGESILVSVEHVTHVLANDPEGAVLMFTGVEGSEGDVHPPFAVVRESLDEVERLLTGEPVAPPAARGWGWLPIQRGAL